MFKNWIIKNWFHTIVCFKLTEKYSQCFYEGICKMYNKVFSDLICPYFKRFSSTLMYEEFEGLNVCCM